MKYSQISRRDHRVRCACCLNVIKSGVWTWHDTKYSGYRFTRVGSCCRVINIDKIKK